MVNVLTFVVAFHGTVALGFCPYIPSFYNTTIPSKDETAMPNQTFESIEITDVKSCIHLCELYTSCRGIRFRRHGNLCVMSHTRIAMDMVTVARKRKVGMVFWSKQDFTQALGPYTDTCSKGTPGPECKTMCVGVEDFTPIGGRLYGNMITEGSKVIYDSQKGPLVEARCQSTGIWTITYDTTCLFTSFVKGNIEGVDSFEYRLCKENVNYDTAAYLCKQHGAAVVQITTMAKYDFFRETLMQPENTHVAYWFDAHDAGLDWYTTDGQQVPLYIITEHTDGELCARLASYYEYNAKNSPCNTEYGFICEIRN